VFPVTMGTAFLTHGCQLAVNGKYIRHAQTQTNHQLSEWQD